MNSDNDLRFDVALSYADEDRWAAIDFHHLLAERGVSVYCYDRQPDLTKGYLRPKLREIYLGSRLNLLLWSRFYRDKPPDSLVALERQTLVSRHVDRPDGDALVVVWLDEAPIERDFRDITAHKIRDRGFTGVTRFVLDRLRIVPSAHSGAAPFHPQGTENARGPITACTFSINAAFRSDPLGRWQRLADVLVVFSAAPTRSDFVYLIPSGLTTPWLRHSGVLRTSPEFLARKRRSTEEFAATRSGRTLAGHWFMMGHSGRDHVTMYCAEYDHFLNQSFQEHFDDAG